MLIAIRPVVGNARKQETAAHEMVRRIDALYAIEREIKTLTPDERMKVRHERASPLSGNSWETPGLSICGTT
jgi:transposase